MITYKYTVDDSKDYDEQPAEKTLAESLCKKDAPQIGLLDFSFARIGPAANLGFIKKTATAKAGNGGYAHVKGTDHLLHFQVFEIGSAKAAKRKRLERRNGQRRMKVYNVAQDATKPRRNAVLPGGAAEAAAAEAAKAAAAKAAAAEAAKAVK